MRDAFIRELTVLAREDPRVFLVVGDLGFSVIEEFQAEFPDRFLNPGVDEQATLGIAAGLAASGYSVYVYSIGNFPTMRPLEQIRNDVCYHGRDVTVVSVGGGFSYGYLGYTHHALEDIAVMRALPGMTVFSPADPAEARVLTRASLARGGPHYIRLGKNGERVLHADPIEFDDLHRGSRLRDGSDVTILATGSIAESALEAATILEGQGISASVWSVPVIKPLDLDFDAIVGPGRPVVTVEEHTLHGGLASAVLEEAAVAGRALRLWPLHALESTVGSIVGSQQWARDRNRLGIGDIADAARSALSSARSALGSH